MDAPGWMGDDDRDELGPDYEAEACPECGVPPEEPCLPSCECAYCRIRSQGDGHP